MGVLDDMVAQALEQQQKAASRRYAATSDARVANQEVREREGVQVHDTMDQLEARARRLVQLGETSVEAVVNVAVSDIPDRRVAFERIIGETNDLQSWSFLPRGTLTCETVARITMVENGRELPLGTGFLISPRLLMTNNHVLPDVAAARSVVIEFRAGVDINNQPMTPVRFVLDSDALFITETHLDFTVVPVAPGMDGTSAGDVFGWNRLIRQQGKIVTGEPVNIVGHPMGRLKEISIRNNSLLLQLDDFLHYDTDTEPGNSGSPVYNDQWEIVALHHSGVPKTDSKGRLLRKDGKLWKPADGEGAIDWVANEGARVSRILETLTQLLPQLSPAQQALLAETGPQAGLGQEAVPAPGPALVARPIGAIVPGAVTGAVGNGAVPPTTVPTTTGIGIAPVTPPSVPVVTPAPVPAPPAAPVPAPIPGQRGTTSAAERLGLSGGAAGVRLVYLHGRSQQGRDPARLRRAWTAGLNEGLAAADLPIVDARSAWFPFYGDKFAEVLSARESMVVFDSGEPAESLAPEDAARDVYEELIAEAARNAGMSDEVLEAEVSADEALGGFGAGVVGTLQKQLSWLAGRSGLDDVAIALLFRDVATYLSKPAVRDAVLAAVLANFPASGPVVLVSHSLGTVVAMDLISRLGAGFEMPLLITAGSPLGMDAVYKKLLAGGPVRPAHVGHWTNVWCPPDPVAIGSPLGDSWNGQIEEIITDNPKERAHAIEEYLAEPRVAARISGALTVQVSPIG